MDKYSSEKIQSELVLLNKDLQPNHHWIIKDEKLTKKFEFEDFISAFGWMSSAAIWAEKLNHHPEWFNVYRHVNVQLTTHDLGGISELDFTLAHKLEACKKS